MIKKPSTHQRKPALTTLMRLAKDPRVQRAVVTLAPIVIGWLKNRKKSKKR